MLGGSKVVGIVESVVDRIGGSVVDSRGLVTLLGDSAVVGMVKSVVDSIGVSEVMVSVDESVGMDSVLGDSESVVDPVGISEVVGVLASVVNSVGEETLFGDPGIVGISESVVE